MGKILAVDDEYYCLECMALLLSQGGYEVIRAENGHKALECLIKYIDEIDLVLLDLMMPDLHGLEVLSMIKENDVLKHVPVLIQTGTSSQQDLNMALTLGAIGYIRKPFVKQDILSAISKILNMVNNRKKEISA